MNIIRYGSNSCHLKRINANELENLIEPEIIKILHNPKVAIHFLNTEKVAQNNINFVWQKLQIEQKQAIAKELVNKIIIDHFEINLRPEKELFDDAKSKSFTRSHTNIIKNDDDSIIKLQQENQNKPIKKMITKAINLKKKYKNLSFSSIAKLENKSKSQIARIFRMNYLVPEIQNQILSLTFLCNLRVQDFENFPKDKDDQLKWFEALIKQKTIN